MSIYITEFEQHSPEWYQARLGNVGASSISKILTTKGELSKQREDYLYQLAGEIVSGRAEEGFKSQAMINGTEREAENRTLFELKYGVEVRQCALVYKDERRRYHCSPDGLVDDNALLEIKSPMLKTQAKLLCGSREIPSEYFAQCQMQLFVCEREKLYFFSAYAGLPPFIVETGRDDKFIKKLESSLEAFCDELEQTVERLKAVI